MGRRPVENKKSPADYPQFAFRVTKQTKKDLNELVEQVQTKMNRRRAEGAPFINKNDVIVQALFEGLKRVAQLRP